MKLNSRLILFTILLVVLATASKLLFAPKLEWSGFSPVIAIALLSGMIVKDKSKSFLLPLVALVMSDVLIQIFYLAGMFPFAGFYKYQLFNYALLLVSVLIGWAVQGKNYLNILIGTLAAPTVFFLISNFMVWAGNGGYQRPHTVGGLLLCYADGLPFYKNALIATLVYVPASIGLYNLLAKRTYSLKLA
ncbi:MAG: hypothetical protein KGO81_01705 [Bacteroidota bacterium]|nr:hypothetical protein [Bacteroidota bacterium]